MTVRVQCDHFRYVIILLTLLCLTFLFGNTFLFNFTVICMNVPNAGGNGTVALEVPLFPAHQTSWLFSVVALGTLAGIALATQLIPRLGGRWSLALYGTASGLATIAMPWCVWGGFWPMVVVRLVQGVGNGISFAALGMVVSGWSTLSSTGFTVSVVSSYIQTGPMYTSFVASEFCKSEFGWPMACYVQGLLTVVVVALLVSVYRDHPSAHPFVGAKELHLIETGKSAVSMKKSKVEAVPYWHILSDHYVWGLMYTAFGNILGQQIFLVYGAIYLHRVLHLSVESTGVAALIANAFCIVLKLAVSPLSDYGTCVSQKTRAKVFTAGMHAVMAGAFVVLALIDERQAWLGVGAYVAVFMSSLQSVGYLKTVQLSCRQFSYIILSALSGVNCIIVLLLPFFVTVLAPNNSPAEWRRVFCLIGVVVALGIVVFGATAQTDPRPWTLSAHKVHPVNNIQIQIKSEQEVCKQKLDF